MRTKDSPIRVRVAQAESSTVRIDCFGCFLWPGSVWDPLARCWHCAGRPANYRLTASESKKPASGLSGKRHSQLLKTITGCRGEFGAGDKGFSIEQIVRRNSRCQMPDMGVRDQEFHCGSLLQHLLSTLLESLHSMSIRYHRLRDPRSGALDWIQ